MRSKAADSANFVGFLVVSRMRAGLFLVCGVGIDRLFCMQRAVERKLKISFRDLICCGSRLGDNPANEFLCRGHRWKQTGGIQDEDHFGRDVDESGQQRIEKSECSEGDTNAINNKRTHEILHNGAMTPACSPNSLHEFREIGADQNYIRAFASYVGSRAHSNSDSRLGERWSVVDAISYHYDPSAIRK